MYVARVLQVTAINLSSQDSVSVGLTWLPCKVPALLGVPLAVLRRSPAPHVHDSQVVTFLMVDPQTGLADPTLDLSHVWVARIDGEDFSSDELWALHDYNCFLMDVWPGSELLPFKFIFIDLFIS